jgi:hypothetical protein
VLKLNKDEFAANVLYLDDVKAEVRDRKLKIDSEDYDLVDSLMNDINKLGYDFKFESDLRWRKIKDKRVIPILKKYIFKFKNTGRMEDFIGIIAHRGFLEATPIVLELYDKIKGQAPNCQCASCDNALYKIQDTRFIDKYLEFLSKKEDVIRLPLTMVMLAKWKIPKAKAYFTTYLNSSNRELVFIAVECLGYYKGDECIVNALAEHLNSTDIDIANIIKKSLKKLNGKSF